MTILDLASDPTFEPDDYRSQIGRTAELMHCSVTSCKARHVPATNTVRFGRVGVCGYCRSKVKAAHVCRSQPTPNVPKPG